MWVLSAKVLHYCLISRIRRKQQNNFFISIEKNIIQRRLLITIKKYFITQLLHLTLIDEVVVWCFIFYENKN